MGSQCKQSCGKKPLFFEEFFDLGLEESASPFLTPSSRRWGHNLPVRTAILAACMLTLSFLLSLAPALMPLSNLALVAVFFLVGIPALIETIKDLTQLTLNIDVLMTLAAFSSILIDSGMEGGLLLVLFAVAGAMEEAVTSKAKGTLNALHQLVPTKATVIDETGLLVEKSVKDLTVGAKILIRAGELVPLDGIVIEGSSSVNLVHLTGENLPVTKVPGDEVPAGGRNLEGALTLRVTHTSNDSTLAKIIQLVTQAQEAKPRLQRWFDKVSQHYATAIIALSSLFALFLPFLLNLPFLGPEGSFYRSLAFLIACSPCALIIAIPVAYLSAISACANKGILLKGGITLDALANCRAMAFDKTGTLTTGKLRCSDVATLGSSSEKKLTLALKTAVALERNAVHPIAQALQEYGKEKNIEPAKLKGFKSIPGYGLQAQVESDEGPLEAVIGHVSFIAERLSKERRLQLEERADKMKQKGFLVAALHLGDDLYLFEFEDSTRPKILRTLKALKAHYNLSLLMLTGDHEENAKKVAKELGFDRYYANLRPDEKLKHVSALAEQEGLAMVGDGINDAPALARATVGISMGQTGSTAAIDAADIVLLQDNIELMDWLVGKAKKTQIIVRENLFIAASAIILTSIPALAGYVPLWLAVVLHEGGTVIVGLNALRLLKKSHN